MASQTEIFTVTEVRPIWAKINDEKRFQFANVTLHNATGVHKDDVVLLQGCARRFVVVKKEKNVLMLQLLNKDKDDLFFEGDESGLLGRGTVCGKRKEKIIN